MHGVLNHALRQVIRVARGCYRALVAFGALWLPLPEDQLRRILYGDRPEEQGPGTGTGHDSGSGTTAAATASPAPTGPSPSTGPSRDGDTGPAAAGSTAGGSAGRPARHPAGRPAGRLGTPPGPPPGHPERLCVDVPLSELELGLARQLKGV
ncbi:DUF6059 family protein [Streptomyces sp. NPDC015130]|uniref:DUF6059 family protein n=1 Tax=Streptomyces sp. NPDC015130 TaxID=3364940 RepID=UPI0036FF825C